MFAARGIAVSCSVFFLVYGGLSVAVCVAWRALWRSFRAYPPRRVADLLFTMRAFPLISAIAITAVFTVPSFLLLEPRSIEEPLGGISLLLGICGVMLGMVGMVNAGWALHRASRAIAGWTRGSQGIETASPVPVLRVARPAPAMVATGLVRHRVLMSPMAESVLTANELRRSLDHEVAHVRRHDNLKKLVFRLVTFPGMADLESAWLAATEMAADDAAVANAAEALDLATALIKLSRLSSVELPVDLTAALVRGPASAVQARVERLVAWNENRDLRLKKYFRRYGFAAALAIMITLAISYSQLLVHVHTATEWLVR